MAAPRISKFTGTVQWSDGTNFNGFAEVVTVMPADAGVDRLLLMPGADKTPVRRLPVRAIIPIVDGEYNDSVGVFYNADISPPNSQYAAYFFDSSRVQIGSATSPFTVSSEETTIAVPTLTPPSAGSTVPDP